MSLPKGALLNIFKTTKIQPTWFTNGGYNVYVSQGAQKFPAVKLWKKMSVSLSKTPFFQARSLTDDNF